MRSLWGHRHYIMLAVAMLCFLAAWLLSLGIAALVWLLLGVAAVAIFLSVVDDIRIRRGRLRAGLDALGVQVAWLPNINPGSSMLNALEDRAGVPSPSISGLFIQTCELTHRYIMGFKKELDFRGVHPDKLEIVGMGHSRDREALEAAYEGKAEVACSAERLTEHFNILESPKGTFVWFEPRHDVENGGTFSPQDGGYLVRVFPDKVAEVHRRFDEAKLPDCPNEELEPEIANDTAEVPQTGGLEADAPREIECEDRVFVLNEPAPCKVFTEDGVWVVLCEPLCIRAYADSREEAMAEFCEAFAVAWDEYASANESSLAPDALPVRTYIREIVQEVRPK